MNLSFIFLILYLITIVSSVDPQCESNEFLNQDNDKCEECSKQRISNDISQYHCTKCDDRYTCTECDSRYNLFLFTEMVNDKQATYCKKCQYPCNKCQGSNGKTCLSCAVQIEYDVNREDESKNCVCKKGYFDNDKDYNQCNKCQNQCETCEDSSSNCLTCKDNQNRKKLTPKCDCIDTKYDNNGICEDCHYPCLNCTSPTNCTTCHSTLNRNSAPSCTCKNGFYNDTTNNCQNCDDVCEQCYQNANICTQCKSSRKNIPYCDQCADGYELKNNNCVLKDIIQFDPNGTELEKESRCLDIAKDNNSKKHCQICRPDKDNKGEILQNGSENNLGSYGLQKYSNILQCKTTINEDKQENEKIDKCEIYDNYENCIKCMIGYGLQWDNDIIINENTVGGYKCINNRYRTQYCHKYNQQNECIECKWNQNPDFNNIYTTQNDESYLLDFGLYTFKGVIYCVNNQGDDNQMLFIDKDFKTQDKRPNCAQYNNKYQCQKCHSRQFDLEGLNQWDFSPEQASFEHYGKDYMVNDLRSTQKGSCVQYPRNYITDPKFLLYFSTDASNAISQLSTCIDTMKLYEDSENSEMYGCALVQNNENCQKYHFQWDHDVFQKTGQWYKKGAKCYSCRSGFVLSVQTGFCEKSPNNIICTEYDFSKNMCVKCSGQQFLYYDNEKKIYECSVISSTIQNCKLHEFEKENNTFKPYCKQCNFGYLPQLENNKKTKCEKIDDFIPKGCEILNEDGTCNKSGLLGFNQNGLCDYGNFKNIDYLCLSKKGFKNIENCEYYLNTYDQSKCQKCQQGYELNESWDLCIKFDENQENNFVEQCEVSDGIWCQKCKRGVVINNQTINFILTDRNTCVEEKGNDQHCLYAKYHDVENNANLGSCIQCIEKYELDQNNNCRLKTEYLNEKDNLSLIYLVNDSIHQEFGLLTDNCQIYRDTQGNCYQCDNKDNKKYGIVLTSDNQLKCEECQQNQILQMNINGEMICVNKVENCLIYDYQNYCIKCIKEYRLTTNQNDKQFICIPKDDCNYKNEGRQILTNSEICVKTPDPNCLFTDSSITQYEFFLEDNKIKSRCQICKTDENATETCAKNYFVDAQQNYLCKTFCEFQNPPDLTLEENQKYLDTRVFTDVKTDTPKVHFTQDKYYNSVCTFKLGVHNYQYIENLGYCDEYNDNFEIQHCFIYNSDEKVCKQCNPGFHLKQDKKECIFRAAHPTLAVKQIENCLYETGTPIYTADKCLKCEYGYALTQDREKCQPVNSLGCIIINSTDNLSCDMCLYPFVIVKNDNSKFECQFIIEKCIKQTEINKCDECDQGYQYHQKANKCIKRSEACRENDLDKTYDFESNTKKSDVCKKCILETDYIRLFKNDYTDNKLAQSCVQGCQTLNRKMNERSDQNQHYIWGCSKCKTHEYHYNESIQRCVYANKIPNCNIYLDKTSDFKELCQVCANNYYLTDSGKTCKECILTDNCSIQDNEANSLINDKCKCRVCQNTPQNTYLLNSDGSCSKIENVQNCADSYDKFGKCLSCSGSNFYLNREQNKCINYSNNLNCGNGNFNKYNDQCVKCDYSNKNFNLLDTSTMKCVKGKIDNCYIYENSSKCKQCDSGWGLSQEQDSCLQNNQPQTTNNCFKYSQFTIENIQVCIQCERGYALDDSFQDFSKQCLKINYCEKAITVKDSNNNYINYCVKCKLRDYKEGGNISEIKRVFRKHQNSNKQSTCELEDGSDNTLIPFCKIYLDYDTKQCKECHLGFTIDGNGKDYGKKCVSDEHPGAIAGCENYSYINKVDHIYQLKYEWLECQKCSSKWKYYKNIESSIQENKLNKFSLNSYNSYCDYIETLEINIPKQNIWQGKDGGLRSINNENGDDDDGNQVIDLDDRETYEDPIIYSNILNCSLILLLVILATVLI